MKKIFIASIVLFSSFTVFGQTNISDNDTICDCSNAGSGFNNGGNVNFFDGAGSGADYLPNTNDTITFCPDGGASKISVAFGIDQGFTWDIDASDTLYIYDGSSTSGTLVGAYNTSTNPNGIPAFTASWGNTSGCLTLVFISDGAGEGTGWGANISCGNPVQPFTPHMDAFINGEANGGTDLIDDLNPSDTGYVDVCFGDTIMFVGSADFPYDPANTGNGGYDQIGNHSYSWSFSNGDTFTGDTIYFVPPYRSGFLVRLDILDAFPQTQTIFSVVRVSTVPSFATCGALHDTLCEGGLTQLYGGVTSGDTVGVDGQAGSIDIGGAFATLTYLPDGSGQNYTTDIDIQGFPVGATIQNGTDVSRVCLKMEHSYLGDLEMKLSCPNGQSVNIFNAYSGGNSGALYPSGFGGGGTYIGGAKDNSTGTPGVCEEYCFSEQLGALPSWDNGSYNTIPASGPSIGIMIEPGTYNPEGSFSSLVGCPVNGLWTITVRDNQSIDDGYICEWGLFLSGTLDPNTENYTPIFNDGFWSPNQTILSGNNDTAIVILPVLGTNSYTFNVEDSFGCAYDTLIKVEAIQKTSIGNPGSACLDGHVAFTGTYAPEGGNWFYNGPGNLSFSPSTTFINPNVSADVAGTYTILFHGVQCSDTVSQEVTFLPNPTANIIDDEITICRGDSVSITVETTDPNNVIWNGNPLLSTQTITVSEEGIYTANVVNQCASASDQFKLVLEDCVIPNIITPNGDGDNDFFFTNIAETYEDTHILIFNRWGRKVYENKSYDNSWDGKSNGGATLASGVYYYVLDYNGGSKTEKGFITIVK